MGCSQILTVDIKGLQKNLLLIRLVNMGFNGMFSDLHCIYKGLTEEPFLIRLVNMGFNGMFSDTHCRYKGLTEEPAFNQIGEHGFQWDVLRSSLYI